MSSGNAPTNFKSVIIRQRLDEMRFRIIRTSSIDFEGDTQKLKQLREQAHSIADTDLELYAINVLGLLHTVLGKLNQANSIYENGSRLALQWGNNERWVNFRLNQAVIHNTKGEYHIAKALFEGYLPTLKTILVNADNVTGLYLTYCYLAQLYVAIQDYDGAEIYVKHFFEKWDTPEVALIRQERRAELVNMAREALSSVYLERGQIEEARTQVQLVLETALKESRIPQTISAYLAFIRLAVFATHDDPEPYWQQVIDSIAPLLEARAPMLWRIASMTLMAEARMYKERGKINWARRCVEKAVEVLTTVEDVETLQAAKIFLVELPT